MTTRAEYVHRVRFDSPGPPTPDGDGGWTQPWIPLTPAEWRVAIRSATARDLENAVAGTVSATATHIVTGDYHPGVTVKTRLTKLVDNRIFLVTGVQNVNEENETMVLVCDELVL